MPLIKIHCAVHHDKHVYLEYIGQFTTDIQYIKGIDNTIADALSRIDAIHKAIDLETLAKEQEEDRQIKDILTANKGLQLTQIPIPGTITRIYCDTDSPVRSTSRSTQTLPTSKVHRGTQVSTLHLGLDQATQSDSDWEPTTRSASTQTEDAARPTSPELRSYTSPGTSPAWKRCRSALVEIRALSPEPGQWGPIQYTRTAPHIAYRERRT